MIIDISRLLRLQTGGQGAIARRASASNTELHQLACVVPGDALSIQGEPVHQLARSWLQYRLKERAYSERQKRPASIKSVQRASKSPQRASQTFSSRLPRVCVS